MADFKKSYTADSIEGLVNQVAADSSQIDKGQTAGILAHNLGAGIKGRKINILTDGTSKNTQQKEYTSALIEAAPELQQILAEYAGSLPPGYAVSYEYIPRTNELKVHTVFNGQSIGNRPMTVILEDSMGRTGGTASKGAQVMVVDRNKQGQTMATQAAVLGMQNLTKALSDRASNLYKYAAAAARLNPNDPIQAKAQKALFAKMGNSMAYYMKDAMKAARPGESMIGSAAHTYKTPNPQTNLQIEQSLAYGSLIDGFFNSPGIKQLLKQANSSAREA